MSERSRRLNEAIAGYYQALAAGQPPDRASLLARHPDLAEELAAFLDDKDAFERRAGPATLPAPASPPSEGTTTLAGAPAPPAAPVRSFGDYELLGEIAR